MRAWPQLLVIVIAAAAASTAAACARRPAAREPADPLACPEGRPPVKLVGNPARTAIVTGRLRAALEARRVCSGEWTYVVVEAALAVTAEQRTTLERLGARAQHPVAVEARPDERRSVVAMAAGIESTLVLVQVPADALPFVTALPWVTALWRPDGHPPLPIWPDAIRNKLDPSLRSAMREPAAAPYPVVEAIGAADGCLDASRRATLAGLGVIVHPFGPPCSDGAVGDEIFTFVTPRAVLEDVAALPWIRQVDGGPLYFDEPRAR